MPRKPYNLDPYLQKQVFAFNAAQEQVFPDKRDLRQALGITPAMYYNYSKGKAVLQAPMLYNRRKEVPELVPFVELFQKHLWGIDG